MRVWLLLVFALSCASCGLVPSRSYLAEMEEDDSSFFEPNQDFQVVPGDTGRSWRSKKDWRRRTPASEASVMRDREKNSLKRELGKLESAQDEEAMKHYMKYGPKLGSTSERIYFLQLRSRSERDEYLEARGLYEPETKSFHDRQFASVSSELVRGMSKEDVQGVWGPPERVDIAGKAQYENERWLYRRDGAAKYVFFERGLVAGWSSAAR